MLEGVPEGRVAVRRARVVEEILTVSWDLARERGLGALSLREVAARMGMRAPSLYTYVASKDALYDAMFAQGQRALLAEAQESLSLPRSREGLLRGTEAYVAFCLADPARYQLLFQRVVPGFEPSAASYALAEEYYGVFARFLAEAGITDPAHLDLWTAAVSGLVAQQLANDPGGGRWQRLVPEMVTMLCDHAGLP